MTPIGSLVLGSAGRGLYFEEFPRQLPHNLEQNKQVCVLAVNSSRWFWLRSLIAGKFASPPAVRLSGVVGERRVATEKERRRWQNRVKHVRFTKGHALLWRRMGLVREIEFTQIEPVCIGEMTREAWEASPTAFGTV